MTGPRIDLDCIVLHIDTLQSSSILGAYDSPLKNTRRNLLDLPKHSGKKAFGTEMQQQHNENKHFSRRKHAGRRRGKHCQSGTGTPLSPFVEIKQGGLSRGLQRDLRFPRYAGSTTSAGGRHAGGRHAALS